MTNLQIAGVFVVCGLIWLAFLFGHAVGEEHILHTYLCVR
jgi:hypothetical protein